MPPRYHFAAILGLLLVGLGTALAQDDAPRIKDVCTVPPRGAFLNDSNITVWKQKVM